MRPMRLAVAILSLAVIAGPTAAHARHTNGDWRGLTEQGGDVKMRTVRIDLDGTRAIPYWSYTISYLCDDGTEGTTSFGRGSYGLLIIDGESRFKEADIFWTGHFSHNHARGTVQYQSQRCDSGLLTWTADHMHPPE